MTLNLALSNALSGLTAMSRMADVVAQNLANTATDGYGVRRVDLSSASLDGRGQGVRVDGIARHADARLLHDRRMADAARAGADRLTEGLRAVEQALGADEDGSSLGARIAALEAALTTAAADPWSTLRQGAVLSRLGDVAQGFAAADAAIRQGRERADADIAAGVTQLNADLTEVARLNRDIATATATGRDANALLDQRQILVDRIGALVPVRELPRPGGAVALVSPGGAVLLDGEPARIGFTPATAIAAAQTLASGGVAGLTIDGRPAGPDGTGPLAGGALAASFKLRDGALPTAQAQLDALAYDLADRLRGADPTLAGAPGLLTEARALPAPTPGLAGRLTVNATADPVQGGALWRLRDGLGAATPGPAGDATQLRALAAALAVPRAPAPGARAEGASALAATFATGLASRRLDAEDVALRATARHAVLDDAVAAQGIDSDHELQMLLRIEQAHAANARLIQTVDDMLDTLMRL